jgi:hypothetical protein
MTQRINIQYSINMESLPQEVNRLLRGTFMKLEEITKTTAIDNVLSLAATREIEKVRLTLIDVDHALNDINNLINGYLAYETQKNISQATDTDETENTEQSNSGEFEEKVARLQEAIAAAKENEVPTPG